MALGLVVVVVDCCGLVDFLGGIVVGRGSVCCGGCTWGLGWLEIVDGSMDESVVVVWDRGEGIWEVNGENNSTQVGASIIISLVVAQVLAKSLQLLGDTVSIRAIENG